MKCYSCGAEIQDNVLVCPQCGCAVKKPVQTGLTKKEFLKTADMKSCRTNILVAAILLYFSAAVTLLLTQSWLDVALLLGLGLWLHIGKSRVCAIITTVYGLINMVIVSIASGSLGGWLILAAGIDAIFYTFKFNSAWKKYQEQSAAPGAGTTTVNATNEIY